MALVYSIYKHPLKHCGSTQTKIQNFLILLMHLNLISSCISSNFHFLLFLHYFCSRSNPAIPANLVGHQRVPLISEMNCVLVTTAVLRIERARTDGMKSALYNSKKPSKIKTWLPNEALWPGRILKLIPIEKTCGFKWFLTCKFVVSYQLLRARAKRPLHCALLIDLSRLNLGMF